MDFRMINGTVKWFNETKGYGFITGEGKEYFVHFKEIKSDGYKTLQPGEQVSFTSESTPKGLVAKSVVKNSVI